MRGSVKFLYNICTSIVPDVLIKNTQPFESYGSHSVGLFQTIINLFDLNLIEAAAAAAAAAAAVFQA